MTHTYTITGMTCSGCTTTIKDQIEKHPEVTLAEISLEQNEAIVHMTNHVPTSELKLLLGADNKYSISDSELPTKEKTNHVQYKEVEEKKSWLSTYRPLLTIFLFITLVSVITSIAPASGSPTPCR